MLDQRDINIDIDKFIYNLFDFALNNKASDIHIEPEETYARVRVRIDGRLNEILHVNKDNYGKLISKLKLLSNMDISEHRRPQDSSLKLDVYQNIDFRVSSIGTINGEKLVIRILSLENHKNNANLLGFNEKSKVSLRNALKKRSGMLIFSGPTGSGENSIIVTDTIIKLNQGLKASTKFLNKMILL
ncbi:ATPase, T2SS/T4P/T4SS family [Anaerococcus nagyae]|uniref:ATPase, T2SS/T4P/T4SS family n=1 Tax=Anaerococcus nagyae TaxID=1755241 RepID=UPI003254B9EB